MSAVCQEAALFALQEDLAMTEVHARHFDLALKAVTPRITAQMLDFYEQYASTSGLNSI